MPSVGAGQDTDLSDATTELAGKSQRGNRPVRLAEAQTVRAVPLTNKESWQASGRIRPSQEPLHASEHRTTVGRRIAAKDPSATGVTCWPGARYPSTRKLAADVRPAARSLGDVVGRCERVRLLRQLDVVELEVAGPVLAVG
jgi:hypothetical protein